MRIIINPKRGLATRSKKVPDIFTEKQRLLLVKEWYEKLESLSGEKIKISFTATAINILIKDKSKGEIIPFDSYRDFILQAEAAYKKYKKYAK